MLLSLAGVAAVLMTLSGLPIGRIASEFAPAGVILERRAGLAVVGIGILVGVAVAMLAT